jgi:hypothetical protein
LGSGARETETLACTSLHHVCRSGGNGWKRITADFPVSGLGRAAGCSSCGVVSSVSGWGSGSSQGGLESGEISSFGDRSIRVDGDEAVFATFLRVLINETTRVDAGHLRVVESSNFLEFTGVGIATILREAR